MMVESMPEMAKMLLDKCIVTTGSKDHPDNYQVMYDFFCLETRGQYIVKNIKMNTYFNEKH